MSRFFAAGVGVDEDPVTGSAHCSLAPFWGQKMAKTKMTGFQASKRSGLVGCELLDDRVILSGRAITVFRIDILAS